MNLFNKTTANFAAANLAAANFAAAASAALAIGAAGVLATAPGVNAQHRSDPFSDSKTTKATKTSKAPPVSCPPGQSYAHIKMGGLLFKKTAFKGCGSPTTIAYWERQRKADMNRRWRNFGLAVFDGMKTMGDQMQQDAQRQMDRRRKCTTSFIGSTAYTNCY